MSDTRTRYPSEGGCLPGIPGPPGPPGKDGSALALANVAALRAFTKGLSPIWLEGYYAAGDGGEGWFNIGVTASDNGGTIFATAGGTYYRERQNQPFSVRWFGAKGDNTTDDSVAFQSAITAAIAIKGAVYIPATAARYRINTALNATNSSNLLIYGDGAFPFTTRITPTGGSVVAGNTGAGLPIIDAMGASGLVLRDITFGTISMPTPSTYGILMGDSTNSGSDRGSNNALENVTFMMAATGVSCAVYGVNVNLLKLLNVQTISDYSVYISNTNGLNVVPPYGTFGSNVQSDGIYSNGCCFGGYGTQFPLTLVQANIASWHQLYVVNVNGGAGYTGVVAAVSMTDCTDIKMKLEVDYFPSAMVLFGETTDLDVTGVIFHSDTPVPADVPGVIAFEGTACRGCTFGIRALQGFSPNYWYGSNNTPTMVFMFGCTFLFSSEISTNVLYLNFTGVEPTPLFNCYLNGDIDAPGLGLLINGVPMGTSTYRLFVNGLRTGTL